MRMPTDSELSYLWAKTSKKSDGEWHPLILHLLDVATAADAILEREPDKTKMFMASTLGLPWENSRSWLLLIIACHDLGKACPGFQHKWPLLLNKTGLPSPRSPNMKANHAFISQIALTELLQEHDWPPELADLAADAVGCHHGKRATERTKDAAAFDLHIGSGERLAAVRNAWIQARRSLFGALFEVFRPEQIPGKSTLSGPDFMLLSGLTSFSDWIGSNEDWFPYGRPEDCDDLKSWFEKRTKNAERALNVIGWGCRTPLSKEPKSFEQTFDFSPRPLQQAVYECLADLNEPSVLLIEAPMGEGKTEAAFYAHLDLQRQLGHRGLYIALPTKATGNAMFKRTLDFLRKQGMNRTLDMQLIHGGTFFEDTFQSLKISEIHDETTGGEIRAGEWFSHKKRALLSEYGVGTVDQAIMPILPVKHQFVRLWGLANRVVIFDEIHAYDAYTGTLLIQLLRWLLALGSSVVLLSATLPSSIRQKLARLVGAPLPESEAEYPRLSVFRTGHAVTQKHFEADATRRRTLRLLCTQPDLPDLQTAIEEHLSAGGMGLALVNTVQRAQDLYCLFPNGQPLEREGQRIGKRLPDGTEIYLFHARFPADRRQKREDQALETFGNIGKARSGRKLLIATQVAEQSLDLDFDLIVTDLAPIDLILQRAGRLWRHERGPRPLPEPLLIIAGLSGEEPPLFGRPLWWSSVYPESLLLQTWILLHGRTILTLPDEIDELVQAVYEERVECPESLRERLDNAILAGDGNTMALRNLANRAIIGFPDDDSWNQPDIFMLFDEDEPGIHRTLMAQTRIGKDSVIAIPLWQSDGYHPDEKPNSAQAKKWFLRSVNLSRTSVVKKLQAQGVPEGWKSSTFLRNCFPLLLTPEGRWTLNEKVRLDDDLGIVYESEEVQ